MKTKKNSLKAFFENPLPGIFSICLLFILSLSCAQNDSDTPENKVKNEAEIQVKKIDACSVITVAELVSIVGGEIIASDTPVLLEQGDYYHYISLCNFYHSGNVITIKVAQMKKAGNPKQSRDSNFNIQKNHDNVVQIETLEFGNVPAIFVINKEEGLDIKMSSLVFFVGEFELNVISDFMNKEQLVKASEKIIGRI